MYEIADYDKLYRPYNKSGGELEHPDFVKLPANPKGDGLQELLEHKRGLEVFAIWCLLLEKTTVEKPENRGKLLNRKEQPATESEIARGISLKSKVALVKYALSVLVSMGWVTNSEKSEQSSAKVPPKLSKDKLSKGKDKAFKRFWDCYPRKVGKGKAEEEFFKIQPNSELLERMIAAVSVQEKTEQWTKDNKQFVPYPSTWLHQKRWEDVIEPPSKPQASRETTAQYKERIRKEYEPYLRQKTHAALLDLKKDKGQIWHIAGWLIDEILAETQPATSKGGR